MNDPLHVVTQQLETTHQGSLEASAKTNKLQVVRYVSNAHTPFKSEYLDAQALHRLGLVQGVAAAGRGNTTFFTLDDQSLVLRQYYRGGLARKLSQQRYVYTGLDKTRAFREFDLLVHLQTLKLPAPQPFACGVSRHGLFYSASLITYRLAGDTLASLLQANAKLSCNEQHNKQLWASVGTTIAKFHKAGVYHADLNAHNILIDVSSFEQGEHSDNMAVSLIDFDRGSLRSLPQAPAKAGWCANNIDRFERSCKKILSGSVALHSDTTKNTDCIVATRMQQFSHCKAAWAEAMSESN